MKRRPITEKDARNFVEMLRQWEVVSNGPLNWQSYIKHIELIVGHLYERTTLYKTKGGEILREFQLAKDRLKVSSSPKGRGSTMSRQNLLKAYAKQSVDVERLRDENAHLLKLHVKYMRLMFDNDIFPGDD